MTNRRAHFCGGLRSCVMAVAMAGTLVTFSFYVRAQQTESGFRHDADQPIEVASDSLEVAKDQETAIFQGNVAAKQGSMGLRADTLKVKYQQSGQAGSSSPFSRIDATGSVVLTSPQETATGDWAVYEVDSKTITLGGTVVLTRGENVINGQRLVVDLITGRSRVDGGDVAVGTSTGKQRVRAVFTPKKKNDAN